MKTLDERARAVLLAIVELSLDSCSRTHQVIRHLGAGVGAASIVRLVHAVHLGQCDATIIPHDSKFPDMWSADANARNAEDGTLARSTSASRVRAK